jgi:hypothetical protein
MWCGAAYYVEKPWQINDAVVIYALYAELWRGNKPTVMTQPQHAFGLPPRRVKEYVRWSYSIAYLYVQSLA